MHEQVRNDEELNKLFANVTIAQGGVLPNIHSVLLPKKKDTTVETPVEKKEKKPVVKAEKKSRVKKVVEETPAETAETEA